MKNKKERRSLFSLIIFLSAVAIIIIIASIFIINQEPKETLPQIQPQKENLRLRELNTQETSDEVVSIEKDLNETNLSDLDKELNDIEKEISLP
jgi:cytoskeletal protein RodZ